MGISSRGRSHGSHHTHQLGVNYTLIFHALSHASISVFYYNHLNVAVTVLVPFGHLTKAETVQLVLTSFLYQYKELYYS